MAPATSSGAAWFGAAAGDGRGGGPGAGLPGAGAPVHALCGPSPLAPASDRRAPQMTHSQEGLGIHLAQALGYLHSRRRHIKTWSALFMGERGPGLGTPGPAPPERPEPHPPAQHLPRHCSWSSRATGKRKGGEGARPQRVRSGSKPPSTGQRAPGCHTGYTICHHPQAVSQMVKDMDTKLLFCRKWPQPVHTHTRVTGRVDPQTRGAERGWGRGAPRPRRPRRWGLGANLPPTPQVGTRALPCQGGAAGGASDFSLLSWSF